VNEPYDYDPTTPPPPPQPPGQAPPPHGQGYPPPAPNPQGSYTNRSCIYCGYNLTGLQPGGTCPECGTPLPQPFNPSNNLPTNGMAVTAMVMGICSIPACFFYGVPGVIFGAIGLVLVRIARKQMEKDAFAQASHGFNQAGFICSLVGLILGLLYMLIVVGFIVFIVLVATYGTNAYAAYGIGISLLAMVVVVGFGFGLAGATLTGQYLGAGQLRQALKSVRKTLILATGSLTILGLFASLVARPFLGTMTANDEMLDIAILFVWVIAALMPLIGCEITYAGALRGAGDTMFPLKATLVGLLIRLALALVVVTLGLPIVWLFATLFADYLVKAWLLYRRFNGRKWLKHPSEQ